MVHDRPSKLMSVYQLFKNCISTMETVSEAR